MDYSLDAAWVDAVSFNEHYFPAWRGFSDLYWSNALAGEAGEICSAVKKRLGGGTSNKPAPTDEEVHEEYADAFLYLALREAARGQSHVDFAKRIHDKMVKNTIRMDSRIESVQPRMLG